MKNNKSKKKRKNNNELLLPIGVIALIVLVTAIILYINREREYKINVDGKEYICTDRKEYTDSDFIIGFSKEHFNSVEEALESCKQYEKTTYSATGELEEYQEKRDKCSYKDEDDEKYYLYIDNVYNYTNCKEVKKEAE